jgi:hypothetical protein
MTSSRRVLRLKAWVLAMLKLLVWLLFLLPVALVVTLMLMPL